MNKAGLVEWIQMKLPLNKIIRKSSCYTEALLVKQDGSPPYKKREKS